MSIIKVNNLSFKYEGSTDKIFENVSFLIDTDWKLGLIGKNGTGKSSILKILKGENINFEGDLKKINDIKISYVPQTTENITGNIKEIARKEGIEESIWKAMLVKMGVNKDDFEKQLQNLSEGQKKKVLIAKSISQNANLYIWDEPLNYIDIITRI